MNNKHSKPGTPATKAWGQMKQLLDAEMPVQDKGKYKKGNNRKYGILLLLLLLGGCGIYKLYNYNVAKNEMLVKTAIIEEYGSKAIERSEEDLQAPLAKNKNAATLPSHEKVKYDNFTNSKNTNDKSTISDQKKYPGTALTVIEKNSGANKSVAPKSITTQYLKRKIEKQKAKRILPLVNLANNSLAINKKNNQTPLPNSKEYNPTTNSVSTIEAKDINVSNESKNLTQETLVAINENAIPDVANEEHTDSIKHNSVTAIENNKTKNTNTKIAGTRRLRTMHFGLEWNAFVPFNNNTVFVEGNARKRPLISLIPTLWLSKELSHKSMLYISLNPYNQYYFSGQRTVQSGNFMINAVSASTINQPTLPTQLVQTYTVNKIIGIEAAFQYAYQISKNWSVGFTLSNTWTNTAIFKETIVKNKTEVIKDSLYGVIKTDNDWQYIRRSFASGKISLAYNFKHYQVGTTISKPLSNPLKVASENNAPLNLQLFFRWKF